MKSFTFHYRNREDHNLDSDTVALFAFLYRIWQIILSGSIVKRAGLSTTPLRTLFKHFKKSQMLWVLIPVPPRLPGAQWDPRHPQEVQEDFSSSLLSRPTAFLIGVQGQTRMETREAKIHNETKIANCSPKVNEKSSLIAFSSYALLSLIELLMLFVITITRLWVSLLASSIR